MLDPNDRDESSGWVDIVRQGPESVAAGLVAAFTGKAVEPQADLYGSEELQTLFRTKFDEVNRSIVRDGVVLSILRLPQVADLSESISLSIELVWLASELQVIEGASHSAIEQLWSRVWDLQELQHAEVAGVVCGLLAESGPREPEFFWTSVLQRLGANGLAASLTGVMRWGAAETLDWLFQNLKEPNDLELGIVSVLPQLVEDHGQELSDYFDESPTSEIVAWVRRIGVKYEIPLRIRTSSLIDLEQRITRTTDWAEEAPSAAEAARRMAGVKELVANEVRNLRLRLEEDLSDRESA